MAEILAGVKPGDWLIGGWCDEFAQVASVGKKRAYLGGGKFVQIATGFRGRERWRFATGWERANRLKIEHKRAARRAMQKELDHDKIAAILGSTYRLLDPKGGDISEFPKDLQVRQMPGEGL